MRLTRLAVGIAAAVIVAALGAGAVFVVRQLAAGRGTVLDRMVPSDAIAYASADLDPPADQKVDLLQLSRKFPDVATQGDVEHNLNQALQPLGLTYSSDVKPWLGAQVVAVAAGGKPDLALLLDSKDDAAAQKALTKLEGGAEGRKASWRQSRHGGVALEVGTLRGQTAVLADFDHTVLLASSESLADSIIDTDQGRRAPLDRTIEYRSLTGRLPASRLVTIYVDGDGLRAAARTAGRVPYGLGITPPVVAPGVAVPGAAAYRGVAAALAARPDGLTADLELDIDVARLPADQRELYRKTSRANAALSWMPAGATGVAATTKLDAVAKAFTGFLDSISPSTSQQLQQEGVSGAGGALDSLTGDGALEVEGTPAGDNLAFGAVIGSSNPAALAALADRLGEGQIASAVQGQYVVLASSAAEVSRLQSAHAGGAALAGSAVYRQASDYSVPNPDTLVYVDVAQAFHLAGRLGAGGNPDFRAQESRWSALRAVLVTTGVNSSGGSTKVRLLVS